MKNVFVLSSSIRAGSNSEILAKEFAKGATEAGNNVEFVSLKNFNLKFCLGCLACQKIGKCVIDDDVKSVIQKVSDSDVLVFATPLYYYEMSGQLKTFLDRINPLFGKDNKFRDVYLLGACFDGSEDAFDRAISGLGGWLDCFDGARLAGTLFATSTNDPNSVSEDFKQKAYNLGKNIR